MADVMIARESRLVSVDGQEVRVRRNRTTAHSDHPIVKNHPELWVPLTVDHITQKKAKKD